jgi:hypothetical protein
VPRPKVPPSTPSPLSSSSSTSAPGTSPASSACAAALTETRFAAGLRQDGQLSESPLSRSRQVELAGEHDSQLVTCVARMPGVDREDSAQGGLASQLVYNGLEVAASTRQAPVPGQRPAQPGLQGTARQPLGPIRQHIGDPSRCL